MTNKLLYNSRFAHRTVFRGAAIAAGKTADDARGGGGGGSAAGAAARPKAGP